MDNVDLSKLSEKERIYVERMSEGEGWTIHETLRRLLRVFKVVLLMAFIITAIGVVEFIRSDNGSFYSYLFVYFIVLVVFYFMAPVKLGAKIIYYKLI